MSPSPFISAIVPCFNVGSLLERTIDSLLAQTLPPREILIIDDASTSAETLAALEAAEAVPSVTVLRQPTNQGVAAARNRGLDTCRGDFAVFLDADDLFTAPSLAAFHDALANAPDASFAYPTVTCFGNRNDTFPAPEFNAYLLHHANICPIASMITRGAIDSGVRFDTAISVGHEDWDYWLRLVDAGYLGCAAPDAVLLYRRVGFTRNDLGNQMEGGFEASHRSLRPAIFDRARLMPLKRDWAPGISILSTDPERAVRQLASQTCTDAEILPLGEASDPRGRIVVFEWAGSDHWLQDPFAVEDIAALGSFIAADQVLVSLTSSAVRPGTPSGIPRAMDLRKGWASSEDIAAVALPHRSARDILGAGIDVETFIAELLREFGVASDHRVLWRSPQHMPSAMSRVGAAVPEQAHTGGRSASGWTADVLTGLHVASPWRLASRNGLFLKREPSVLRDSVWVDDPFGGTSLYGDEEDLLLGSTLLVAGPTLPQAAAAGTAALLRCEDQQSHRRSIAIGDPPRGTILQEVLGRVEVQEVPGSRRLTGSRGASADAGTYGWVYTGLRDDGATWPRSSDVLFDARVLWRARSADDFYAYTFNPHALQRTGMTIECRLMILSQYETPGSHAIWSLVDERGRVRGMSASRKPPEGTLRLGVPLGYLRNDDAAHCDLQPVISLFNAEAESMLCTLGGDDFTPPSGFERVERLGLTAPC